MPVAANVSCVFSSRSRVSGNRNECHHREHRNDAQHEVRLDDRDTARSGSDWSALSPMPTLFARHTEKREREEHQRSGDEQRAAELVPAFEAEDLEYATVDYSNATSMPCCCSVAKYTSSSVGSAGSRLSGRSAPTTRISARPPIKSRRHDRQPLAQRGNFSGRDHLLPQPPLELARSARPVRLRRECGRYP